MGTLVLAQQLGAAVAASEEIRLIGLPTERSAKRQLSEPADKVLGSISAILNEMVIGAIEQRVAADFSAVRKDAFPKYLELVISFSRIVSALVPKQVVSRLASESFSELEADLREHGIGSFGTHMTDRGLFTVWTLRKISDLLELLDKPTVNAGQHEKDMEFVQNFLIHALLARFHVDCLIASMRTKRPIYPDVLPVVEDGLCSVVNAYAWVKQAVDLRFPVDESPLPPYMTDEDQLLLDASMRDLASEKDSF